jgi:hypothetical protein
MKRPQRRGIDASLRRDGADPMAAEALALVAGQCTDEIGASR